MEYPLIGIPVYLCLDPYHQEWHVYYDEKSGIKSIEKIPAEGQIVAINADLAVSWEGSSEGIVFYWQGKRVLSPNERADQEKADRLKADAQSRSRESRSLKSRRQSRSRESRSLKS